MKNIELEYRALIDEEKYNKLNKFFQDSGEDLGQDDKDTHFYILPDKLLKLTHNISKNNAKITLKLNKIGVGSDFKEIEVPIDPDQMPKMMEMFTALGFSDHMQSYQFRHNYIYKDIEFAVKYTHSWGFHVEMELMIDENDDKEVKIRQIKEVADELGVILMTDPELKEFTDKLETRTYLRGEYTNEEFAEKHA